MSADERSDVLGRYRREIERLEAARDYGAANRLRLELHKELVELRKREERQ